MTNWMTINARVLERQGSNLVVRIASSSAGVSGLAIVTNLPPLRHWTLGADTNQWDTGRDINCYVMRIGSNAISGTTTYVPLFDFGRITR